MSNLVPLNDIRGMAQAIASSGLFGMKNIDQALALMLVAQAEGQHPATITQDYDIIQGRAARKTHSVLSRFQQMGGSVKWHELTDQVADATFSHKSGGELRIQWTIEQAKKIGLTSKDNWKNYPRAMLRARCIAEGVRAIYPAALGGMMVSEEAQDVTIDQPITVEAHVVDEAPSGPPAYPDEDMEKNFPAWASAIKDGRTTPDRIVSMVSSKYSLSKTQIQKIQNLYKCGSPSTDEHVSAESAE